MSKYVCPLLTFGVCFLLCEGLALAQLDPKWEVDDSGLAKRISFIHNSITVGELFESLSIQSGVNIAFDEPKSGSPAPVAVFLKDIPLSDVMRSIWSLMSYKGAKWEWSRDLSRSRAEYRLRVPKAAATYGEVLTEECAKAFLHHAEIMLRASKLSPERRHEVTQEVAASLLDVNDETAAAIIKDENLWAGLRIFAEIVPISEYRSVLIGGSADIAVPIAKLSDNSRDFLIGMWTKQASSATMRVNGKMVPVPPPTYVSFRVSRLSNELTPSLFIDVEHLGGYSYLGGVPLNQGFQRRLFSLWLQTEDSESDSRATTLISEKPNTKSTEVLDPVARALADLSEGAGISLVARLPDRISGGLGTVRGQNLDRILAGWSHRHIFMNKWRNGVLLLDTPSWFTTIESNVSWPIIKRLRLLAKAVERLPIEEAIRTVAALPSTQVMRLAQEFSTIRGFAPIRPLLVLAGAGRSPRRILSDSGVTVSSNLIDTLLPLAQGIATNGKPPTAIRVKEYTRGEGGLLPATVELEVRHQNGKWLPIYGFQEAASPSSISGR